MNYGIGDVMILWNLFSRKYKDPLDHPLTFAERRSLIDEVDQMRENYEKSSISLGNQKAMP